MAQAKLSEEATPAADDGWIEWAGGECPVSPDALIQVQFRIDTREQAARSEFEDGDCALVWEHSGSLGDIIAYRVVKP